MIQETYKTEIDKFFLDLSFYKSSPNLGEYIILDKNLNHQFKNIKTFLENIENWTYNKVLSNFIIRFVFFPNNKSLYEELEKDVDKKVLNNSTHYLNLLKVFTVDDTDFFLRSSKNLMAKLTNIVIFSKSSETINFKTFKMLCDIDIFETIYEKYFLSVPTMKKFIEDKESLVSETFLKLMCSEKEKEIILFLVEHVCNIFKKMLKEQKDLKTKSNEVESFLFKLKKYTNNKEKYIFNEEFFQNKELNKEDPDEIVNCIQDYYNYVLKQKEEKRNFCKQMFTFCKNSCFKKELLECFINYIFKEYLVCNQEELILSEFLYLILPYEFLYKNYTIFFEGYLKNISLKELNKIVDIEIHSNSIVIYESIKYLEEELRSILEKIKISRNSIPDLIPIEKIQDEIISDTITEEDLEICKMEISTVKHEASSSINSTSFDDNLLSGYFDNFVFNCINSNRRRENYKLNILQYFRDRYHLSLKRDDEYNYLNILSQIEHYLDTITLTFFDCIEMFILKLYRVNCLDKNIPFKDVFSKNFYIDFIPILHEELSFKVILHSDEIRNSQIIANIQTFYIAEILEEIVFKRKFTDEKKQMLCNIMHNYTFAMEKNFVSLEKTIKHAITLSGYSELLYYNGLE